MKTGCLRFSGSIQSNQSHSVGSKTKNFEYSLIKVDPLAATLWEVHLAVKKEGYLQVKCIYGPLFESLELTSSFQGHTLGLFRSDYMIHVDPTIRDSTDHPELKQVEFNTYSIAGGSHSNKVTEMHQYISSYRLLFRVRQTKAW